MGAVVGASSTGSSPKVSSPVPKNSPDLTTGSTSSGGIKSVFSSLGSLGKKVPGVNAVTTGSNVVSGLAWEGGRQVAGSFFDAIKDPGLVLFIAGLLTFFTGFFKETSLAIMISTVFMFFAAFFIFKGKSLFFVGIFWIIYVYIGINNMDVYTLLRYLVISLLAGMFAHGLFSKAKHEGFAEGAFGEVIGLVPIAIFLIDVGFISWVIQKFGMVVSGPFANIMLFTPWWAMLGVFTTKKENALITIAKFITLIYICLFLFAGVSSTAEGETLSGIPGVADFAQAKQQMEQQLPKTENPAWSNLVCILEEPTDMASCVQKRQEASELKYICEEIEKYKPGTAGYDKCLEEQKKMRNEKLIQISGISDSTIKQPTTAEIKLSQYFPTSITNGVGFPLSFPVVIANPRNQKFTVEAYCNFTLQGVKEPLLGVITGGDISDNTWSVSGYSPSRTFGCEPDPSVELKKGTYKVTFGARLLGLNTTSRLQRAFIGMKPDEVREEWKKEWIPKIMSAHFPGQTSLSQGPADLARLSFAFGNPIESPIVETSATGKINLFFSSIVENGGNGKILAIKRYHFDLDEQENLGEFGIQSGNNAGDSLNDCFSGTEIKLPDTKRWYKEKIPLPSCIITSLPPELANPEVYDYHEFEGVLTYDYEITKDVNLEVNVVELVS